MGAPVGQLAARVFVPPAELVVAPRMVRLDDFALVVLLLRHFAERGDGGLAEPQIPIEFLRRTNRRQTGRRRSSANRIIKSWFAV